MGKLVIDEDHLVPLIDCVDNILRSTSHNIDIETTSKTPSLPTFVSPRDVFKATMSNADFAIEFSNGNLFKFAPKLVMPSKIVKSGLTFISKLANLNMTSTQKDLA